MEAMNPLLREKKVHSGTCVQTEAESPRGTQSPLSSVVTCVPV